jgi:hypothetical protein
MISLRFSTVSEHGSRHISRTNELLSPCKWQLMAINRGTLILKDEPQQETYNKEAQGTASNQ